MKERPRENRPTPLARRCLDNPTHSRKIKRNGKKIRLVIKKSRNNKKRAETMKHTQQMYKEKKQKKKWIHKEEEEENGIGQEGPTI